VEPQRGLHGACGAGADSALHDPVEGFDFLRDNLALTAAETVLSDRPLDKAYCLVDEVGSLRHRLVGPVRWAL
jgi:hypothetical protein